MVVSVVVMVVAVAAAAAAAVVVVVVVVLVLIVVVVVCINAVWQRITMILSGIAARNVQSSILLGLVRGREIGGHKSSRPPLALVAPRASAQWPN